MNIDKIVRSNRRTIALTVQPDGQVVVRAPILAKAERIQQFVEEKQAWIRKKQEALQARKASIPRHQFQPGELFLFLGETYPLEWSDRVIPYLLFSNGNFSLAVSAIPMARTAFTDWYRNRAKMVILQRVQYYATLYQLRYHAVRINSARTRWGSCSVKGNLSFTWRLILAPLPVIDYVVVHELAHLVEKNHSRRFWDRVASMMKNYSERRTWLNKYGYLLTMEEHASTSPFSNETEP